MTKKIYFDCPLISAYMAENFGVKFIAKGKEGGDFLGLDITDGEVWFQPFAGKDYKFYIAPESLDIFEPKEGDVLEYYDNAFLEDYPQHHIWTAGSNKYYWKRKDYKIIMRNNKPFHMAKGEINNDPK